MMGQSKEPRGKVYQQPLDVTLSRDRQAKPNSSRHTPSFCICPFPVFPAASSLFKVSTLLGPISQHTANIITHCGSQGLKAACKIWADLCSLDPSLLLVSRSLHLGLAPASAGWIFTLCLWAPPQELPVPCGSCSAMFDHSLAQVHMKLPRLFFPLSCGMALCSAQRPPHCGLAALRPALLSRPHTNVCTMLRYQCQPQNKANFSGLTALLWPFRVELGYSWPAWAVLVVYPQAHSSLWRSSRSFIK